MLEWYLQEISRNKSEVETTMKLYLKTLIIFVIAIFVIGMIFREQLIRQYPSDVRHYQNIMKEISSKEYIERLQNYTGKYALERHYAFVLQYLGEELTYTEEFIERHEDPIEILEYGKGRCGEFTIAYTALLLANGYNVRIIYDASAGEGNGDHMWVEVWSSRWIHIDPTEGATWTTTPFVNIFYNPYINNPYMYEQDWEKELTEVWGIEPTWCGRVEENYKWEG